MRVLVVGGAGYIGSHTARALAEGGHEVVLLDNLSFGHAEVADRLGVPMVQADLGDGERLRQVLTERRTEAVIHFAAFAFVGESVVDPARYYRNNVVGSFHLLEAMRAAGVGRIIFSSTAATYGVPQTATIAEDHPQQPINPYGRTKLVVERMLADYEAAYGLRHVVLRYFNAAGAASDGLLGEDHEPETHLIPLCMQAATGARGPLTVFGADYPTPDGTCIRDYVHVEDLASAHVLALEHLAAGGESLRLNVGTGSGYSVRQVLAAVERVAGTPVPTRDGDRRPGDPPVLVADGRRIRERLGWRPRHAELDAIVGTAWRWFETTGGRFS